MEHMGGDAGQPVQAGGLVQIAGQRHDGLLAQRRRRLGRARQRQHAHAWRQRPCRPRADVAATDDQHARAPKARRQRAVRVLV